MATWNYVWEAASQIIGTGDGWVTLAGTAQTTAAVNFETSGQLGCHVLAEVDFDASPTDYVDVKLYGSLDGGVNFDDTPLLTVRVDKATDPNQISIPLPGDLCAYVVGCVQSGTTDSHNVRVYVQMFSGENA